ncbi:LysR family transcriptional regulator [uncultured Litoreibacter sp.]|uniref:LysR family transcriptional regulator n=1 Tax=uncultured Litoreibacter sp. TaxID=1392394 RepID=UPI0026102313|nr:LysR family transcriptional regulator [uncultured Litoreibacter sp.]
MSHRLPPLNGLRAFEAAARHLSFKIAARELGVTAGAVSQQVKSLEETLGVKLFRRLPRGLLLTDAGSAYLPELSRAFRIISKSTEAVAPALSSRKLQIGVAENLGKLLPRNWPAECLDLTANIAHPTKTSDPELVRSGEIDGLLLLQQLYTHGLSNEAVASINDNGTSRNIFFVCSIGLAGCRQSRALVKSLVQNFSEPVAKADFVG